MSQFKVIPNGEKPSSEECFTLEAESAVHDTASGAISFFDADSNLVGRVLNASFHRSDIAPAEPEA